MGISPERAARDQADQVYYVPENMTYREWESKYIQNYKPVTRGKDVDFQYSTEKTINAKAVEGYDNVYVSDKAEIKPKALHDINQKTEKYMKMWGVPLSEKPKIVIVDQLEIVRAYGRYDAASNTVYYSPVIANSKKLEEIGRNSEELARIGDTESHEMWHAKQAYDYRRSGHTITKENQGEYFKSLCKKCKKNIDKLGITEYNVREISAYASKQYAAGRYDEVEAEYMMLHRKE